MSDFAVVLSELATLFERKRIAYMVIGGVAVDYWGIQRVTVDVDCWTSRPRRPFSLECRALQPGGVTG